MKFGMRKPSLKRSLKARTTGCAKRAVKKALILVMERQFIIDFSFTVNFGL